MLNVFSGLWAKVGWYVLAASVIAGLAAGTVWYTMNKRLASKAEEIRTLNGTILRAAEQRTTDKATLDRLARKNAAMARETASARASLQRSLSANREWADQPVPKEVQDALRQP
jgi:hypothetical protein